MKRCRFCEEVSKRNQQNEAGRKDGNVILLRAGLVGTICQRGVILEKELLSDTPLLYCPMCGNKINGKKTESIPE